MRFFGASKVHNKCGDGGQTGGTEQPSEGDATVHRRGLSEAQKADLTALGNDMAAQGTFAVEVLKGRYFSGNRNSDKKARE
jgi:hypothetical protein